MHLDLVVECLVLLALSNGTPILARRVLGDRLSRPIDGGFTLPDGHQLFGPSKTIRGLVATLTVTALLAPTIGVSWMNGLAIAAASIAGDLLSSFAKRRLGLPPSSRCTGLDQIPEALFPAVTGIPLLGLSVYDAVLVVGLFFGGAVVMSPVLSKLNIRRHPY